MRTALRHTGATILREDSRRYAARWVVLACLLFVLVVPSRATGQTSLSNKGKKQHPAPGTSIVRFAQIDHDIYKGSRPKSDADFRFLQSLHVRYILDLKFLPLFATLEKKRAKPYGMTVIPVQMNASPIPPSEKHVLHALCVLGNKRLRPVYFHCDIGRDRTALIAALYEIYFRGRSKQQAEEDMKRYEFKGGWSLHGLTSYFEKHAIPPKDLSELCSQP